MKTISVGLEWGSYPLQELDSKGFIVDDIGAEELGLDREFCEKIQKLQDLYAVSYTHLTLPTICSV